MATREIVCGVRPDPPSHGSARVPLFGYDAAWRHPEVLILHGANIAAKTSNNLPVSTTPRWSHFREKGWTHLGEK
jgi:hypothetical protein